MAQIIGFPRRLVRGPHPLVARVEGLARRFAWPLQLELFDDDEEPPACLGHTDA